MFGGDTHENDRQDISALRPQASGPLYPLPHSPAAHFQIQHTNASTFDNERAGTKD